jgi:hypothetical protein
VSVAGIGKSSRCGSDFTFFPRTRLFTFSTRRRRRESWPLRDCWSIATDKRAVHVDKTRVQTDEPVLHLVKGQFTERRDMYACTCRLLARLDWEPLVFTWQARHDWFWSESALLPHGQLKSRTQLVEKTVFDEGRSLPLFNYINGFSLSPPSPPSPSVQISKLKGQLSCDWLTQLLVGAFMGRAATMAVVAGVWH